ncbi:MAG: P22 coat - protein 5 family protein, partial [Deltaproteobacteria bacterium]|nr:P22 coat - protein 5 family protein [Deltaproteobacteria bacterium]
MANTLTNLLPDLYASLDVVSRELVGFIPAVLRDSSVDRAAVGQNVRSFVTPAAVASDIVPGVTPPNDGDQTIGNVAIAITKSRRVPFRWAGEATLGVNNNGPGAAVIRAQQLQQALRTLCNEIEADIAATYTTCSRAYGTAGTTPFASSLADPANVRKILADNGCPMSDMQMVINTTAGAAMRTLAQLTKVNEAADTTMLRQG